MGFVFMKTSIRFLCLWLSGILLVIIIQEQAIMSADSSLNKQEENELLEKSCSSLENNDSFLLIDVLKQDASSIETANRFSNLIRHLYFKKKDVSKMVLCGRIGIQYAISESEKKEDNDETEKLLSLAKEMSYNLSVNCWPGWGDEGIIINSSDLNAGLDAARLNYRLAIKLKKDDEKVANALWLIGAHQLAIHQYENAIQSFESAAQKFEQTENTDLFWMAKGYISLAKFLSKNSKGAQLEKEAFNKLKKIGTEDALYFIKQIETARQIFEKLQDEEK
jgi:hypothetical protein